MTDDRTLVRVLDVDPELGYQLDDENRAAARRYAVAELRVLEPGPWLDAQRPPGTDGNLGLLVLDGLLAHELQLGTGQSAELLGEGDLLRPWDDDRGQSIPGWTTSWRVLEPTRLAVLDHRFAAVVRSARTSNARIKEQLSWSPRFPSARDGVPDAVARLAG